MPSFVRSFGVPLVLVAVGLGVMPQEARAQSVTEPNTVTVTPFLGSAFGASNDLGSSIGFGVAVTYDVTTRLGFEGEIGHVFDLFGDNANVDLGVTNISANGVYNFPLPRVTPYATFGIGVERSGVHVKTPDPAALYPPSSTEVSYNFGGGVKYPVSELFLIRGDIRRFQATDLAPDYWRLYGGVSWWIKR
jgi:opacity protein-like surface antigen